MKASNRIKIVGVLALVMLLLQTTTGFAAGSRFTYEKNNLGGVTLLPSQEYKMARFRSVTVEADQFNEVYVNYGGMNLMFLPEKLGGKPVTAIGPECFYKAGTIQAISIPEGVVEIQDEAFVLFFTLRQAILPDSLKTIGTEAFEYCDDLKYINIPASVTYIGPRAFTSEYVELNIAPDCIYTLMDGAIYHKGDKKLTHYLPGLKNESYEIPRGIKVIGEKAFTNEYIQTVVLPDTLTTIGKEAFAGAPGITQLTLPASLTTIDENALPASLEKITLDKNNTAFEMVDGALYHIESKTLVWREPAAKNKKFVVKDGTKVIANSACNGSTTLETLVLPDSVEVIEESAFSNCSNLKKVEWSDSLVKIEQLAFDSCALDTLELPASVQVIGYAFANNQFKKLVLTGTLNWSEAGYAFRDNKLLESVVIGEGCTVLPSGIFMDCVSLTSVQLPSTLKLIDSSAFKNCSALAEITLPEGLEKIEGWAFDGCSSLKEIVIPASITSMSYDVFPDDTKLIVECDSYAVEYAEKNNYHYEYPDSNDWLSY